MEEKQNLKKRPSNTDICVHFVDTGIKSLVTEKCISRKYDTGSKGERLWYEHLWTAMSSHKRVVIAVYFNLFDFILPALLSNQYLNAIAFSSFVNLLHFVLFPQMHLWLHLNCTLLHQAAALKFRILHVKT